MPALAVAVRQELTAGQQPHRWLTDWQADVRGAPAAALGLMFVEPSTTGHRGYDALLAGLAELEADGLGRPRPRWAAADSRRVEPLWLAGISDGWFALALSETPWQLRRHGVLLPRTELQSV